MSVLVSWEFGVCVYGDCPVGRGGTVGERVPGSGGLVGGAWGVEAGLSRARFVLGVWFDSAPILSSFSPFLLLSSSERVTDVGR